MTIHEQSAGILIFRRSSPPFPRQYLLLDYGKHWDYPKGHLEPGETPHAAALRELAEETGIAEAQIQWTSGFAEQIQYYFRDKKKGLIRKTVVFYLAETTAEKITLSHEHVGYEFLPYEEAIKRLTFATARQVLRRAEEKLAADEQ